MARSGALALEVAAMSRIESAFGAAEDLPESAKRRVRRWAAEQFASPHITDLATAVRKALAADQGASNELIAAAAALADAVDGQHSGD